MKARTKPLPDVLPSLGATSIILRDKLCDLCLLGSLLFLASAYYGSVGHVERAMVIVWNTVSSSHCTRL